MHKTAHQRIAIGGRVHVAEWLCDTRAGQAVLADAYRDPRRPRCMCRGAGVEMYVGRRGSTYYLSRMPGSGLLHEPACPSMEDLNLFSAAADYADGAIVELPDGSVQVRFDPAAERGENPTAVSLDGLLDLLLEISNLHAWSPQDNERGWCAVRERLGSAARTIYLAGGAVLSSCLLLPGAFEKDTYQERKRLQESFLCVQDAIRLVCAPLREIRPARYGWQIVLKHMPTSRIWMPRRVAESMKARAQGTLDCSEASYPALCLLQTRPTGNGGFAVTAGALRRTDRRFVPCLTDAEARVADTLAARQRRFVRPLRFDASWERALADYALVEEGTAPIPIFVLATCGAPALDEAKRGTAAVFARVLGVAHVWQNGGWWKRAP